MESCFVSNVHVDGAWFFFILSGIFFSQPFSLLYLMFNLHLAHRQGGDALLLLEYFPFIPHPAPPPDWISQDLRDSA